MASERGDFQLFLCRGQPAAAFTVLCPAGVGAAVTGWNPQSRVQSRCAGGIPCSLRSLSNAACLQKSSLLMSHQQRPRKERGVRRHLGHGENMSHLETRVSQIDGASDVRPRASRASTVLSWVRAGKAEESTPPPRRLLPTVGVQWSPQPPPPSVSRRDQGGRGGGDPGPPPQQDPQMRMSLG